MERMRGFSMAMGCVLAMAAGTIGCGGAADGGVLPASATPDSMTLDDMASQLSLFTTSNNETKYYPETPIQILFDDRSTDEVTMTGTGSQQHVAATGSNHFDAVPEGTTFYVPVWSFDDSPPIVGEWPKDAASAQKYLFDPAQVGGTYAIEVDGASVSLDASYVAGPVATPPLLDGGGSHFIVIGAFVGPLAPGDHVVVMKGKTDGAAISALGYASIEATATYQVHVVAAE
jgi:hypothetical protein